MTYHLWYSILKDEANYSDRSIRKKLAILTYSLKEYWMKDTVPPSKYGWILGLVDTIRLNTIPIQTCLKYGKTSLKSV